MLRLVNTTDKIEIVLAGAPATTQPCAYACYNDVDASSVTPNRNATLTNGSTSVDLVAAPASGKQRVIDEIGVYNQDSAAVTVTIRFDFNGTEFPLWKGTLGVGERLQYTQQAGWQVYSAAGHLKTVTANGLAVSDSWTEAVLTSTVVNNNATANTLQDITGLTLPVVSGRTYRFELFGSYTSAATTTGSRWTINGPSFSSLAYESTYTLTATTQTINYSAAYLLPAASNASSLTAGNTVYLQGVVAVTADGDLQARFASEVSASAITALPGMTFRARQVV